MLNCRKLATGEIKKAILSHSYKQYFLEGYRFTHNIIKGLFHQMGCQWLDGAVVAAAVGRNDQKVSVP